MSPANQAMHDDDFLQAIEAGPCSQAARLVYADWLDEQGDLRGEMLRIQEELRQLEVPDRPVKEARMHELLAAGAEPLTIARDWFPGMEMILVFPGEFLMGSPPAEGRNRNENQIATRLSEPFYLSRRTVTQWDWISVMKIKPWSGRDCIKEGNNYPAAYLSWNDATAFCEALNYQIETLPENWTFALPTEAQWEYACRAGTSTRYCYGNDESQLTDYAWFDRNAAHAGKMYAPRSGQLEPNPWGVYDMHGGLWEWCRDFYQSALPGGSDPIVTQPAAQRVRRGGCWLNPDVDCRSAVRGFSSPESRVNWLGFRVAVVRNHETHK